MTEAPPQQQAVDQGWSPYTGEPVGAPVPHTTPSDVDVIAAAAAAAAPGLAALPLQRRAGLLRAVAAALESDRDAIVALADAETGLGPTRLAGELTRTRVQLEMFAGVVEDGTVLDVIIDPADPTALPAPRPDLRRMLVPLGPVAVFAASNFPLAFSVAGGDTASALAAGCPVVVKAHPGHPGLSVHCARLVAGALAGTGAPAGSFGAVFGVDAGRALVTHPAISAAGFTGSLAGGRALFDLAAARPDPIPFYGELGSLNPTVLTPGAVAARGAELAQAFVDSVTLGAGQFCTKPGLLFLPAGHDLAGPLAAALARAPLGPLLAARLQTAFQHTAERLAGTPGVRPIVPPATVDGAEGYRVAPALLRVAAADLVAHAEELLTECFGPAALVVEYASTDDLVATLDVVPGSLAATLHAEADAEAELARALLDRLARRAGRVIFAGWPTGVAVSWAQQHGGPWPATTSPLHTSVGVTAVRRFQRPVAYQNLPDALLPEPLRDANPLGVPRRLDGRISTDPVSS
jgi:NADP-dependent aldehyde dehydrogenase